MKIYTLLIREERDQMFVPLTFGARRNDVAEIVRVRKCTISRDFRRNSPEGRLNPYRARRRIK